MNGMPMRAYAYALAHASRTQVCYVAVDQWIGKGRSVDKPRGDGGGDGGECRHVWPCAPCVPNPATAATVSVVTDQSEVAWVASCRAAVWLWGLLAHTLYLHVAQLHLSLEFLLLPCVCCCVPDLVGLRVGESSPSAPVSLLAADE